MKILLFMDNPLIPTGYASTCRLTAKELSSYGHDVYAMGFNGGSPEKVTEWYGIKVVPNYALKRDPNAIYGDAKGVVQAYDEINPDILFLHNDSYRYAYMQGLPQEILDKCVFWLPFEGDCTDEHGCKLFSRVAATRFVTKRALDLHSKLLVGKDIGYIPHAVDVNAISPCPDKKAAKAAKGLGMDDKFVVVRVDRHQPRKYWELTLKAFAKFAADKHDVFLLGKCNPRDITMWDDKKKEGIDLNALATTLDIGGKCHFDDFFFDATYMGKAFYHPADVFMTTTSGEGFGLTPAEAMAAGVPVLYPDTPVLPEVVADGGIVCPIKERIYYDKMNVWHNIADVDAMAAKLNEAYEDWRAGGKKLAAIGARGREIATTKYNPKTVYKQWNDVFNAVAMRGEIATLVTVLYNISGDEQLTGDDGVGKLRESIEKYVRHPYEWVIVDNGSPEREKTRAWMKAAASENARIRPVYLDVNKGFAAANNVGMKMGIGKYAILVNPDSQALNPFDLGLPADFVAMLVEKAKHDASVGVVGMRDQATVEKGHVDGLMRRDDVLGGSKFPYFCCVLITKECMEAVDLGGGRYLDEAFWPAYYEDCDFCLRAVGKGFKVVTHNVPFWHKSGGTNKHAIEGGKDGKAMSPMLAALDEMAKANPDGADWPRKRGELLTHGMQGMIAGNIAYLNKKWGPEARSKVKVVIGSHIGEGVGFSAVAEGMALALNDLGFDVYVDDWYGPNVENPVIQKLIEKCRKAKEDGSIEDAIYIACYLMESFLTLDATYKVGVSLCESTKVRSSYLHACNSMDRILTFSEFCKNTQIMSGYKSPIHVITPGVDPAFMEAPQQRAVSGKFTFLTVGVCQKRKATEETLKAFCETFPKAKFPDVELVIKSNNFGDLSWIDKSGAKDVANVRGIWTGPQAEGAGGGPKNFSTKEMRELYDSAHCLLHASRGEGIGMPILEAAATGMPVIFTRWSSPAEYLDDSNSYPLSLDPKTPFLPAYEGHGCANGENGDWANPGWEHLKQLMMHVYKNREEASRRGMKAAEAVRSRFNWAESARDMIPMLFEWDAERKTKASSSNFDPVTFKRPKMDPIKRGDRVMVDIVTRDRHPYLAALLVSLLGQSFKEWDVIIQIDDADESVLKNHQVTNMLARCGHEGHGWNMIRSHRQGPHIAHDRTLQMVCDHPSYKHKLICRVDDDIILRPDYLENIFKLYLEDEKCEIGAISGVYPFPDRDQKSQTAPADFGTSIEYAGKLDHNVPWPYICFYPAGTKPRSVEHLYSSFMYRREVAHAVGGYCRQFSQIGHREESDFTARFFYGGYKLLIQPESVGFHFSAPSGGIRSESIGPNKQQLSACDDKIYRRRLDKWKKRHAEAKDKSVAVDWSAKKRGKVVTVINGGSDWASISEAVSRFSPLSDEIYVTCDPAAGDVGKAGEATPAKLKMVATTPAESALVTQAILTEGDHEYIMNVTDRTSFTGDPLALLEDGYDDYVFEVYTSYAPSGLLGPEVRNQCLISRRRKDASPRSDRTLYSDMVVIEDSLKEAANGKSVLGRDLLSVSDMSNRPWRKVCVYQFPEGKLSPPRYADMNPSSVVVSIVIPTAGRLEPHFRKCVNSIYSYTHTPFELIVVDNGSSDGTAEFLADEQKKRKNLFVYRQSTNLGYQKAINLGVSRASGKYVMLFNDDAWIQAMEPDGGDWLKFYIRELEANPKLALVGPHGGDSPALGKHILFFWCVMFNRELWNEVGSLDDVTFRNYGGDDDYCERVRAKGYEILEKPTYNIRHLMNLVPKEQKEAELGESRIKLRQKYPEIP